MSDLKFQVLQPDDDKFMLLIADWYLLEWKIPIDKTIQKLKAIALDPHQFHILMTLDDIPVATAGLHHQVGLLDKEPRFKIHKNWVSTVYTIPALRGLGYGTHICNQIIVRAKKLGIKEIHLYTDTAESLYQRLGWTSQERLAYGERNIVVMRKDLNAEK